MTYVLNFYVKRCIIHMNNTLACNSPRWPRKFSPGFSHLTGRVHSSVLYDFYAFNYVQGCDDEI